MYKKSRCNYKMVLEELLAPAGSPEVLTIAVNAGADAVYIAGQKYGATAFLISEDTLFTPLVASITSQV